MRLMPAASRLQSPLTEPERALIARAAADCDLPGPDVAGFWTAPVIDSIIEALCDLMLREGYHSEWEPTPLGREIEALIDKLDGLLTETVAA